jgi:hypothetical protein
MRPDIILALFLVVAAGTGFAQTAEQKPAEDKEPRKHHLYEWTDDKAVVHITDELGKVPPKYRDQARQVEVPKKEKAAEGRQEQQTISGPGHPNAQGREEAGKAEWQRRMKDARQRLADAERRYWALDQKRREALEKWGGPASGRREGLVEAERIEQEMRQAQREIDNARNRIEVVLPEEARKAGVPPGWLRE